MPLKSRIVVSYAAIVLSLLPVWSMDGPGTRNGALALASAQGQPRVPSGNRQAIPHPTALQRHVMFFDANHDGILTPKETRAGLERLGVKGLGGLASALLIHAGMTGITENGGLAISRIGFSKHGSDTGIYDAKGQVVQAA